MSILSGDNPFYRKNSDIGTPMKTYNQFKQDVELSEKVSSYNMSEPLFNKIVTDFKKHIPNVKTDKIKKGEAERPSPEVIDRVVKGINDGWQTYLKKTLPKLLEAYGLAAAKKGLGRDYYDGALVAIQHNLNTMTFAHDTSLDKTMVSMRKFDEIIVETQQGYFNIAFEFADDADGSKARKALGKMPELDYFIGKGEVAYGTPSRDRDNKNTVLVSAASIKLSVNAK